MFFELASKKKTKATPSQSKKAKTSTNVEESPKVSPTTRASTCTTTSQACKPKVKTYAKRNKLSEGTKDATRPR